MITAFRKAFFYSKLSRHIKKPRFSLYLFRRKLLGTLIFILLIFCLYSILQLHYSPSTTKGIFSLFTTKTQTICLSKRETSCIAGEYFHLLADNPYLILLEPAHLAELERSNWEYLQVRFRLPPAGFNSSSHWLPVGFIWNKEKSTFLTDFKLGSFKPVETVSGSVPNITDDSAGIHSSSLHYFLRHDFWLPFTRPLYLHIVVFHPVQEYFWVGKVSEEKRLEKLPPANQLYFGATEQIFDSFEAQALQLHTEGHRERHQISLPDPIDHFLSQLPTSQYLHCPPERRDAWFRAANLTENREKEAINVKAFRDLKALARHLRMEVWIACGTLLGWYRQCSVTPYTTDTDFASWAWYLLNETDMTATLQAATKKLNSKLKLFQRFGEPTATLEFSFLYEKREKVDLFFAYSNGSHLLTPLHSNGHYTYNVYPSFELCSVALLGVKLLAPCDPEAVITAEYGSTWRQPISAYNYLNSPQNVLPFKVYDFGGKQHIRY